ncbi:PREDICTED: enolase-phosphatase E1-like isoform X2 [Nelumbo nucifera]|uniref:Enolase-phosphatase E1-like isoform X1 n=1 Tax=Nelumbo nucifera TaxID=4432 RepID=A0A1U7YU29_NELNU|nr:PREDICTED: enolase-phosphatase E1-like isoform X1 [Nelumbo nucifera]XP_010243853.1 PREDICTED: enolase-phosphatase E1-like isoform X2 [Nelumbo nucifera]
MQNSGDEDQNKQDQRKNTGMEDSTAMTIDFLRARLLSERSVSRTARQRAEELAKRVVELEEQLKLVTLQRKKAEKATAEVLSILENHGISDFSEAFDSSSDQEEASKSKEDDDSTKKEESSVTSELRDKPEELPSLELEGSLPGRSLCWKSSNDSPKSTEKKYMDQARRQRSSLMYTSWSSPRQCPGKSCRQIKRRETRSAEDEVYDRPIQLEDQEKGAATSGQDTDMERALEHQAQLIGQYEAEENAQREWEEKYRENNSCTPDSCEPGNRSDVTEERDYIRPETTEPGKAVLSHDQGIKSEAEGICCHDDATAKTPSSSFVPSTYGDMGCSLDQHSNSSKSTAGNELPAVFSFPDQLNLELNSKVKQKQECPENDHLYQPSSEYPDHCQVQNSSSHMDGNFLEGESSKSQNNSHAVMLHETASGLGSVLEALQRAKLSLKHELDKLPLSTQVGAMARVPEITDPATGADDTIDIPVGCAGLFRVPTDFQFEATCSSHTKLLGSSSNSQLSLTSYYPSVRVGPADRYQYAYSPQLDTETRTSIKKPYVDPYLDAGIGSPTMSRYTYPSYADLMPRMPTGSNDGFQGSRPMPTMSAGSSNGFPRLQPIPRVRMPMSSNDGFPWLQPVPRMPISSSDGFPGLQPMPRMPSNSSDGFPGLQPVSRMPVSSSDGFPGLQPMPRMPSSSSNGFPGRQPMPRMPNSFSDGFPGLTPSMAPGVLSGDRYAVYKDQIRPNMHRY